MGQPYETIVQDTDWDFFMSAKEAKEYGLIDTVISNPLKALRPLPEPVPAGVTVAVLLIESSFWARIPE